MSTTNFRTGITAVAVLVGLVSIGYAQTFTTFDVPGAAGTIPLSINPAGQITGAYFDANFVDHGFLREKDGTIITFDVPDSFDMFPQSINPAGQITGSYLPKVGGISGFLRKKDG